MPATELMLAADAADGDDGGDADADGDGDGEGSDHAHLGAQGMLGWVLQGWREQAQAGAARQAVVAAASKVRGSRALAHALAAWQRWSRARSLAQALVAQALRCVHLQGRGVWACVCMCVCVCMHEGCMGGPVGVRARGRPFGCRQGIPTRHQYKTCACACMQSHPSVSIPRLAGGQVADNVGEIYRWVRSRWAVRRRVEVSRH